MQHRDGRDPAAATALLPTVIELSPDRVTVSAAGSGATAAATLRVLLVDDTVADQRLVRDVLARVGNEPIAVDTAYSVEGALNRLGKARYDACLIDHQLPGRNGFELVRVMQARDIDIPAIVITDGDNASVDAEAIELGVGDLVDKQILSDRQLERTIRFAVARHRQAGRLDRMAQYDELTGLANRSLFRDRLERALASARRHRRKVAVMILDLNGFKAVNDGLGHAAGDELLRIIGERLRDRLRETDTVARMGGDEFAVVAENLDKPAHAAIVARKILDAVAPPITLGGESVSVTASIGIAVYPDDATEEAVLCRLGDAAMYRAKAEGGNVCRFHSEHLDNRVRRGALLESDLRRALEYNELVLYFQPQATLLPGQLGIATLLRWDHPELGLVGSERFLNLAEDTGLLEPLCDWTLQAACAQARAWLDLGLGPLHLAVPLTSRRQLAWSDLKSRLEKHLAAFELDPTCIEIEIAEPLLLADMDSGGHALASIKGAGVRIALGNYGSGPMVFRSIGCDVLDTIKLGHELLEGMAGDHRRMTVIGAILDLAGALGLRRVAEGIAGHEQLSFVRQHGCEAAQCLMSCPPLSVDACTLWLEQAARRGQAG